jgi:uncharacterized protein
MNQNKLPPHIDVKHAAQANLHLAGRNVLSNYERLAQETQGLGLDNHLDWAVHLELREDQAGQATQWLHLTVSTVLPQTCQRCLGLADIVIAIDRQFRFVESEAVAEAQDDESEEDLLVTSREFDLASLIEDEVLMALPLVPRHEVCPIAPKLSVADTDFDAASEKPNPFAQLAQLKGSQAN